MISLAEARQVLGERVAALPSVEMELAGVLGCRLAESPRADQDWPSADVSAMDGYAVRAGDLTAGKALPIALTQPAGAPAAVLPPGWAARVFTGAVIPAGADTVVPQEQTEAQPDGRVLLGSAARGSFVRRAGEICAAGAALADRGAVVTPQLIGLLAAAGAARVRVTPRPRVAIVTTGNELVSIDARPGPGGVRDSNSAMLAALARAAGLDIVSVERAADEPLATRDVLARAWQAADLVVTCGGVSVGDFDLVPAALPELGAELLFHGVSIRPGKPVLVARSEGKWIVGLPGNPLSALVGWRLLGRPLAEALSGDGAGLVERPEPVVLTAAVSNRGDRTMLAPAVLEGGAPPVRVSVLPWKGSHDLMAMGRANALAVVEPGMSLAADEVGGCYRLQAAFRAG